MLHRALLAFLLVIGLSLSGQGLPVAAQPAVSGLIVRTIITYDLRPDDRRVLVRIQARIENQDPQTQRHATGQIAFYDRVTLALHKGARDPRAHGPNGVPLALEPRTVTSALWDWTYVKFDRRLFYQDRYDLTLEYDLVAGESPSATIGESSMTLFVLGQGAESTIVIRAPSQSTYTTTIGAQNCRKEDWAGGVLFTCVGNANFLTWVETSRVEVIRPIARRALEAQANVGERTITVRLSYFREDEQWAGETLRLLQRALPLLREANGHPYRGPDPLEVIESGAVETDGYAGRFGSAIRVSLRAQPGAVIREAARAWSHIFSARWLQEAFAQYTANVVAAQLNVPDEPRAWPTQTGMGDDPPLEEWALLGADEMTARRMSYFYTKSLAFLEELERRVGRSALVLTNANIAASGRAVESRSYLDFLEETTSQDLDDLFGGWVFGGPTRPLVQQRREARKRIQAWGPSLRALDLDIPRAVREPLAAWDFETAVARMEQAEHLFARFGAVRQRMQAHHLDSGKQLRVILASNTSLEPATDFLGQLERAVDAILAADQQINQDHGLVTRIGLLGRHPGRTLDRARDALARDDLVVAEQLALQAVADQRDAISAGRRRVAVGGTAIGALAAFLAFTVMSLRTSRYWGAGHLTEPDRSRGGRQAW